MVKLQREARWCGLGAAKSRQEVADDLLRGFGKLTSSRDKIKVVIVRY